MAEAVGPWVTAFVGLVFAALTVVALTRVRRSGVAGWWVSAMFASMAVYLCGSWVTRSVDVGLNLWLARLWLAVLLLFPYLALRFAASFHGLPRWLDIGAGITAGTLALATTLLQAAEGALPPWVAVYLAVVLVYWVVLSLIAATRLWQGGRAQPTVARRRMRLMSVATIVLAAGLFISGVSGGGNEVAELVVMSLVLLSAVIFAIGFTPPRALVLSWRQPEDQQLRHAMMAVLRATTPEEVAAELLPPVARIVGGSNAALVEADQRVLATYGRHPAIGTIWTPDATGDDAAASREVVPVGEDGRQLVVWTSRYTPFFAREEIDLLHTMGAFASLALERSNLLAQEREQRAVVQQAGAEAERAREAAHRANAAKTDFLSRMSHELRTPLNAILGFGQLLEISDLDSDAQEAVGHIVKAGRHLLALINDVLDLSRVEAGMMTISLEPVQASELIHDTVRLIQPLADARSIRVVNGADEWDAYVMTDRQRCRQVLLNLLSNAVKYNRDGGEVSVGCRHRGNAALRISVTDTGAGIDPAQQERLFEPFERLGAESAGVEGTGLGLALTKQLVEHLGGLIGVDTTPGEGSTFWVDLPVTDEPTAPSATMPVGVSRRAVTEARTLLLVEDNLANLRLIEAILRRRPSVAVEPVMQGTLATELAVAAPTRRDRARPASSRHPRP